MSQHCCWIRLLVRLAGQLWACLASESPVQEISMLFTHLLLSHSMPCNAFAQLDSVWPA